MVLQCTFPVSKKKKSVQLLLYGTLYISVQSNIEVPIICTVTDYKMCTFKAVQQFINDDASLNNYHRRMSIKQLLMAVYTEDCVALSHRSFSSEIYI